MSTQSKITSKIIPICVSALMVSTMFPIAAFADDPQPDPQANIEMRNGNAETGVGTTDVTIGYIDKIANPQDFGDNADKVGEGKDDTIKYSVPTILPMAYKTSGNLVCARGDAYRINNLSIITINMTDATIHPNEGYYINGIGDEQADVALDLKFSYGSASAGNNIQYDPNHNIELCEYRSLSSIIPVTLTDLQLAFGGMITKKEVSDDFFADPDDVGSVVWTVAPLGELPEELPEPSMRSITSIYDGINDAVFATSAPINTFKDVYLDGIRLDNEAYTTREGSTIIALDNMFLNEKHSLGELENGFHTISIESIGGTASADFEIEIPEYE